jgi:teichuronic acid biosynthesis glycosyltransferase TuaH
MNATSGGETRGRWFGTVVFFAGTAWDGNPFPDQHIARRLTEYAPVLYVDPPVSHLSRVFDPGAAARLREPRLRLVADRLARVTPVVLPPKGRGPMRRVTAALTRSAARHAVRALGAEPSAVVVATPQPVFGAIAGAPHVLYATDDFVAGAELMGIPARWLRRSDRLARARADVVVAVSSHLADVLRRRGHKEPLVIENGVDVALFAGADESPAPPDVSLPEPIAGFVGHLSDRIDLDMLEATASTGCSVLLVGPRQGTFELRRIDRLLARPNVAWVGAKAFAELPSYVRMMRVGMVPYALTDFNMASFPLKALEYLAAGRGVVASDLPALRGLGDVVRVAGSVRDFARTVVAELEHPAGGELAESRRSVAARHSWDSAARQFALTIGIAS